VAEGVEGLFEALVDDAPIDDAMVVLADMHGVQLADEYTPFVVALPSAAPGPRAEGPGTVAVRDGDRLLGLLTAPDLDGQVTGAECDAVFAFGEPTPRPELRPALDELRTLVDLGLRLGRTGRMELDEHLPELLLAGSPRLAERVRRKALGALEDYSARRRSELLETLATFISCNLDRREAAGLLEVHPNTLDYRLRRAEELTGLSLGSMSDRLLICLALKQRETRSS
jgi:hypothetical protein